MDALDLYREQLVADLKAMIPRPVTVESHPGRFDINELDNYSLNAPCIRVAVLAATDADLSDLQLDVDVGLYLVTKPGKAGSADRQQLKLGSALLQVLRGNSSLGGDAAVNPPQKLRYTNLYNGRLGDVVIGLGSVSFVQRIELGANAEGDALGSFQKLFADFDLGADNSTPEAQSHNNLQGA